jgi:hypothetical protein
MRGRAQAKMAAQGGIAARLHPDIEAAASNFLHGVQQPCAGRQFGHLGRLRQGLEAGCMDWRASKAASASSSSVP